MPYQILIFCACQSYQWKNFKSLVNPKYLSISKNFYSLYAKLRILITLICKPVHMLWLLNKPILSTMPFTNFLKFIKAQFRKRSEDLKYTRWIIKQSVHWNRVCSEKMHKDMICFFFKKTNARKHQRVDEIHKKARDDAAKEILLTDSQLIIWLNNQRAAF